jgi:hypothetical protein
LKIRPTAPVGISLASIPELIASAAKRYPQLCVHHERRERCTIYVGPIVSMGDRSFTIEDASYYGEWTGARRMRYDDVTQVCFDSGYLRATAMTAQKFRKHK